MFFRIINLSAFLKWYASLSSLLYTILPKGLSHPLLMKGLTTLVISMSTNLNVEAYNDILGNCVLLILYQQFVQDPFLFYHDSVSVYKTRIEEKWWFSQCGRTWLVCRKQLNTSGVTLNEPKTHHQTPVTCTHAYSHFIHFKTLATEVQIQFCFSTWIMFPSLLSQFGSAFFSSKEVVLLSI